MPNKQNDKAWFAKEIAARMAKKAASPFETKRAPAVTKKVVDPVVAKSGRLGKKKK